MKKGNQHSVALHKLERESNQDMTSRHLNVHEINSRLGLWHYQCPENEKHMGVRLQDRIYRYSSAYAVFWHSAIRTVFTMK